MFVNQVGGSQGRRPASASGNPVIRDTLFLLMAFLASSVEVPFLRKNFGERTIDILGTGLGFTALAGAFTFVVPLTGASLSKAMPGALPLFNLFFAAFFLASIYHLWQINRRRRNGVFTHSYYWGDSHLYELAMRLFEELPIKQITFQRLVEPVLVLVVGYMFTFIAAPFGYYLMAAGVAMGVKGQINWSFERTILLDFIDSSILADEIPALTNPAATAREHRGLMIVEAVPNGMSVVQREKLATTMRANSAEHVFDRIDGSGRGQANGDQKARIEDMASRMNPQLRVLMGDGQEGQDGQSPGDTRQEGS